MAILIIIHFCKLKLRNITLQQQLNLSKYLANHVLPIKPPDKTVVVILIYFVKSAMILQNVSNVIMGTSFIIIYVKFVITHAKPVRKIQQIVRHVKTVLFKLETLAYSSVLVELDVQTVMILYAFLVKMAINLLIILKSVFNVQ